MGSQNQGIQGSTFEILESRVLLSGSFPSAAENAIIYDAHGNLDVAYYDSSAHNLKYVQQNVNGTWTQPVTIDGSSPDVGHFVTIAINGQGFPAVAYQDTTNSDLKFAQSNGSSWTVTTVDKRRTTGFNPSLTFDSHGAGYISYYKKNTGDLMLATLKSNKWTIRLLQGAGNVGEFSSIAVNPTTGKVAVAYSNATGKVQYVAASGNTYSKPVTVGAVTGGSTDVSLAFSGTTPAIGYVDPSTGNVNLGQLSGKTFTSSTIATVAPGSGSGAQVLIDPTTNQPAVVYHDATNVYIAAPATQGGTFQVTQVDTGGSNAVAIVQPGSGSIVFSTVNNNGGTLSIDTTVSPPAAPSNVSATATSTSTATITWTDNSSDEAGFLVERSSDNVNFSTIATTQPNIGTFADTGLTEATFYYYRVSAIGAAGNNSAGTTSSTGTQIVPAAGIATATTFPAAPSGLGLFPASASAINIIWTNNSHNPSGFVINRSTDGGNSWTQAGSVGATIASFSDTGLSEATGYIYQIVAYNSGGLTGSTAASGYTLPAAPSALSAMPASNTAITLTWQNNSAAATGFIIQRSTDGQHFSTVGTALPSATSFSNTGLSEATAYYFQVIATGPGGLSSAASAQTNAITNPAAPSNLAATALSSSRIDLSWTNNSTGATSYLVQRAANGGSFSTVATPAGTATSYSDTGRVEGVSYSYRVQALTGGSASGFSAVISTTTLPAAPSALGASASGTTVTLTWNDNSSSETSFLVQRSSDNGANWSTLGSTSAGSSATANYIDTTASEGATYRYRVAAMNTAGRSAYTISSSVTIAPAAPSGLTATGASSTQVNLAWTNVSQGQTGILIERSADGGANWTNVTTTGASATAYSDTSLTPGATYNYRISAVNSGGASGYATATGVTAPAAPVTVNATPASTTEVDLTWTPVSGATSYLVQRSTNGTNWTALNPVSTTSLADLNLTEGTQYQYSVTAINAGGSSTAGGPVSATTLPAAPSSITASGVTAARVLVTWLNGSHGATGFVIERSSGASGWTQVATPTASQSSITDSTVSESTTYTYRIRAVDAGGSSTSTTASAVTTVPLAPTNLSATIANATHVSLSWTNNSSGATSYVIQRSTDSENFSQIGTVNGSTSTYTDATASAATLYWYRVYAIGTGGPSDYSNAPQATTTPAAPQNVAATAPSATSVSLTWDGVNGATGYAIARSTDGTNFTPFNTSSTNSFTDATASEATQYWYTVEAVNGSGNSANSTAAAVTTKPSAPASLSVSGTTSGHVSLAWTNTSHAVTNFKIERSTNNGTSFSQIDTAAGSATTYTDTTVSEGSHYIYRLIATGAGGDSARSSPVGADTNPADPTALSASATSATGVLVTWTPVSAHATNYVVARSDDNGASFNVIATLGSSADHYADTVTEGTAHQYEVRATQTLADNVTVLRSNWTSPQAITTPPATPTNVQATSISATEVVVTWTNNSANETGFKVYRSTDNTAFTQIGTTTSTQFTYDDQSAQAGTQYFYRVRATGAGGDSAPSTSASLTSIPAAPSGLSTSTSSNPHVLVTWNDVTGETSFTVQRSADGGTNWVTVATQSQGSTQFNDTTTVENATYLYRVRASNSSGNSDWSQTSQATTFLAAPTGLSITSTASGEVDLNWTDHSASASGYEVQRSSNGGTSWTTVSSSLASNATSYNDTSVADGTAYSYRVRGLSAGGNSDFTATAGTTTPLLSPTGLTTTTVSTTEVDLSWTNPSATATGFQIWRSTDGGSTYTQIDAVQGTTTYADHTISPGESATYKIVASNVSVSSLASSSATGAALVTAPSNLIVTPTSDTTAHLTWQINSTGATGYQIWRDDGNGAILANTAGATATSFDDSGLTEGTSYIYVVIGVNAGGSSDPSNVAVATTYAAAPSDLVATALSSSSINLTWTDNSNNADGYSVWISSDGENYDLVTASLGGGTTSYLVGGLTEGAQYSFQVYAYNSPGLSASSGVASQTVLPATPTLGSVSAQSDGVRVSWINNSTNATGFEVQRSSDNGSTFDQTFTIAAGQSSYVDSSAASNSHYTYRVRATNSGGESAASTSSNVLTLPAAATGFSGASTTSSSVQLSWTPATQSAGGYNILRSTDGSSWSQIGTAGSSASTYTDSIALAGTTYKYQLVPTNGTGSGPSVTTSWISVLTAAPTGLATTSVSATSVSLHWNDVQGETGFVVQRSTNNTTWTTLGAPSSGQTSFTDSTAAEATAYYYRVAGSDISGTGDYSTGLSVLTTPSAPSSLTATPVSAGEVDLSWTNTSQGATGIDVYRSANSGPSVRIAHALAASTTTYQDQATTGGTSYTYQVFAYNATGSSTAATQTALTVPAQPQSLTAVGSSASQIDLSWDAVTGATQYMIARSANGSTGWTTIGHTGSSTPSFSDTGLTEGTTYSYSVTASDAQGSGVAATASAPTLPSAPTTLTLTSPSSTEVDLSWVDTSVGATGYNVYRSINSGQSFTLITTLNNPSANSYTDTVSEGTAYTYRVVPVDASGEGTGVDASITTVPATPTLTSATVASATEVDLSWTNNSAHATGFTVKRTPFGANTWTTLTSSLSGSTASYNDTSAQGGTRYQYKVIDQGAGGNSADSNLVAALTVPSAVSTMTVNTVSISEIDLSWTAVTGATSYKILRSADGTNFTQTDSVSSVTTSYQDTNGGGGLTEGTRYYYQVVANDATGDSVAGNIEYASTLAAAPSSLSLHVISNNEIDLSWTNNSAHQTSVGIERSSNNTTWTQIGTTGAPTTSIYHDTSVQGGHTYYYRIAAIDEGGTNYMSDAASVAALTYPDAPVVSATPVIDGTISVSWTTPATATTFTVQNSTDGVSWTTIASSTSSTSTIDSSLSGNTVYQYRVSAANATGSGAYSTAISTRTVPDAPSSLTATAVSTSEIDLSWSGDASANVTYRVYRTVGVGAPHYVQIGTTTGATSFADTTATTGNVYTYEVVAANASGQNVTPAFSSQTVTLPAAPGSLARTVVSTTEVDLTWSLASGASSYTVSRSSDGGASYTTLTGSPLSSSATSYNDTAASSGTSYVYKVTSTNASGTNFSTIAALTYPGAPTGLTPTITDNHDISVMWNATTGAASYTLQRTPDGGDTWISVSPLSGTSASDTLAAGATYSYRVKATNATGDSAWATSSSVTTVPDAPTSVSASSTSDTIVHVSWSLSSGATGYFVNRSDDNGSSWTNVSGSLSSSTTSFDNTGLTQLTPYKYEVIAFNGGGNSAASSIQSLVTRPTVPSGLATTLITGTEVDLSWTDNTSGMAGSDVQRSSDGGAHWSTVGSVFPTVTTYADTTTSPGTSYLYRIIADNGSVTSLPSSALPVLTIAAAPTVTATPISNTEVDLSWTSSQSATSYTIFREIGAGGFTQLATGVTLTTYPDSNAGGTSYTYEVFAINATGTSPAGTSSAALTVPDAQSDFAATPISATQVDLSWTDVTGATSYTIQRQPAGGSFSTLTSSLAASDHTYSDTTALPGTSYTYKIVGADATGSSTATTASALTVPGAVTGLAATVNGNSEIDLAWTANTDTVTNYRVMQSTGGAFSQVGSDLASNVTSYNVTGLSSATAYQFEILAVNATGAGPAASNGFVSQYWSGTQTRPDQIVSSPTFTQTEQTINIGSDSYGNTSAMSSIPGAPGGFGSTNWAAQWTGSIRAQYSEQYTFYGTSDDGNRVLINGQAIGDTFSTNHPQRTNSYTVPYSFVAGQVYTVVMQFRQNGGGWDARLEYSSPSLARQFVHPDGAISATTVPDAPANFTATPISNSEIDLAWDAVTGATGYYVQLQNPDSSWTTLTTVGSSTHSLAETGLSAGATYTYRVEAIDVGGASAPSASDSGLTFPAQPTNLVATPISAGEIDLTWATVTGADSYSVQVSTNGGSSWSTLASGLTNSSYADTGATPGTTHQFQVIATNASGDSTAATTSALTVPAAQSDFAATPVSATQVNLNWTDVTGATSYTIQRQPTAGGGFTTLTSSLTASDNTYHDTTAQPATSYTYKIFGADATGNSTATTQSNILTVPAAVSSIHGAVISTSEIDLTWAADAGTVSGYRVLRSDNGGSSFSQVGSDLDSSHTSLNDTGLSAASDHIYRVLALNATGVSGNSDSNTLTTLAATPANFAVTGISNTEIGLSWDAVTGATGYEVDRQNPDSSWATLTAGLTDSDLTFADTGLTGGTTYTYRVEALDAGGASIPTTPQSGLTAPDAPTHVVATPVSVSEVDLAWDAMTGADSYIVSVSTNAGGSWTTLDSNVTTNSFQDSSATAGTSHLFRVVAVNVTGQGPTGTSNSALTIPAAQSDFAATPVSATQVNLSWTDVTGATSYTIQRAVTGSGSFTTVASSLTSSDNTYHDTSAQPATSYTYKIFGSDATGDSAVTTQSNILTVPAAVTNISGTVISTSEIDLTWSADNGTVGGYRVLRSDDGGTSFNQIGTDLSSATLSFNDTGLSEATAHIYRVLAFNDTGASGNSDSNILTTLPDSPANFAVSAISSTRIDLSWDSVARATMYEVDRFDSGVWTPLDSAVDPGVNSFSDTGLTPGTLYTYRMEAIDDGGSSAPTSSQATYTMPAAPTGFTATAVNGNSVSLSWTAPTGATGFHVLRDNGGGFNSIQTTGATSFTDTGLSENTTVSYEIVAYNGSGDSSPSLSRTVTTYLNTPALTVTGVTDTSVSLRWTNHSAADTGYEIDQQNDAGDWIDVHDSSALTVNGDTDTATITGLTEATAYHFRVIANGTSGAVSQPAQASANTAPADPTAITATPASATNINLAWTNNSIAADDVVVERSTDGGTHWAQIDTIAGDAQTYTDTTATEATAYVYRVAADKASSRSNYATTTSVTSLPLAPTGLTPTVVSPTEIDLAWTDVSAHPTAYRVYRSTDGGGSYSQVGGDLASNATSYNDAAAPENATTYYKVVAVDAGGESAGTAITHATTPLAAPSAVVAATTSDTSTGDKTVTLTWTNNSTVNDGVKVERSSDNTNWTPLAMLPSNADSYSDDTASENVTYVYRTYAVAALVSSTHTASNSVTTLLSRPTGLTLASPTSTSVTLNWNDVSSAATSYHVERSTDGSTFSDIATISSSSANSYTDTGRTEGTQYWYRVRAVSGGNTSNFSGVQTITTIPATPSSFSATPFSTTAIDLAWTDVSSTNTSYTIERSTNGGTTWSTLTSALNGVTNTFSDTGLTEGTDYEYRVFALGAGGNSADSNTSATSTLPAAPTGLTFSSSTATSVTFTWTDNSSGETNYEVERSTDGVSWSVLTTSLAANTASYTDSTAAEATAYHYRVRANRNGVESAYTSTLDVTTLPAAPSVLNITSTTSTKVTIAWTDNSNGETGFKVARSTDGGISFSVIASPAANSSSYSDNTVGEGQSYSYYVYAYNTAGNSTNSNTVVANILPSAPTALTVTGATPSSVSLSWTNNSSHQTGVFVERNVNSGGWNQIADVISGNTFTDSNTEAVSYQYRVRAHGATGNSSYSLTVSQKTPLIAPTSLTATTISATQVNLTWSDNSSNESGYGLERSADGGSTWTVISLAANTTSYNNTGLTEGTTYTYRVRATRSGFNSSYTGNQTATTLPATPSSVSATATSQSQVTVTWTNNSAGATGFTIQRSTDNATWTTAGTTNGSTTTFNDSGLLELTTYYYRVQASNAGGVSAWAAGGSTVTTLPAAPSNLALSAPTSDSVALTWTDNTSGATAYKVERNNGGGWTQIALLGSTATSYTDLSVAEATTYTYRVRATAGSVNSAYSGSQSITTVPLAPDTLVANTISTSEIDLTWNNNSTGATHYLVERSDDGGDTFTQIAQLGSSATSYNNTGLIEGTQYQYRVRAQNAGGFSDFTDSVAATTLPAAPTNLSASPSSGQIDLTWDDNSGGESSYTVQRFNGGVWTTIATLSPDSQDFSDTGATGGLISGHTYQYRVFCSNDGGNSGIASTSAVAV